LIKDNSEFEKIFFDNVYNLENKVVSLTTLFKIFEKFSRKLEFNLMPFYDQLSSKYTQSVRK
jgi:hypothetical protein